MLKPEKSFSRDIRASLWGGCTLLLGFSLWGYHPQDPSFNSTGVGQGVLNICGLFGAYVSDLLYQFMGLSAWVVVLACAYICVQQFFVGFRSSPKLVKSGLLILLVVTCASLGQLHGDGHGFFGGHISTGGVLGAWVVRALLQAFGFVGSATILWTCALVLLVFYTQATFREWAHLFMRGARYLMVPRHLFLWPFHIAKAVVTKWRAPFGTQVPQQEADEPALTPRPLVEQEPAPVLDQMGLRVTADPRFEAPKFEPQKEGFFSMDSGPQLANWELPHLKLLDDPVSAGPSVDRYELKSRSKILADKLAQFNVRGEVVGVRPGPAVTLFEFRPNADVKVSKITDLADDLALALSSKSVRIIAPIPGRNVVGVEAANPTQKVVHLKEVFLSQEFWSKNKSLPLALGCDVGGVQAVVDLRKMPHLLVAGSTGSGKSVFITSTLLSLVFRHSPNTLKLVLIDPKQVDLAAFSKLPHLLLPPIYDPKKAVGALKWAVREMEKRYRSMSRFGSRHLEAFNQKVSALTPQERDQHQDQNASAPNASSAGEGYYFTPQPYVVVVVEEFGDLMAVDKAAVEHQVVRLAQMARACGMHLVLATQSPRKDVVTGLIKTNIPGRISFKVASKLDSRIILDEGGAERLLAKGDMLFLAPGVSAPTRYHGPWVSDLDIQSVCDFWINQAPETADEAGAKVSCRAEDVSSFLETKTSTDSSAGGVDAMDEPMYEQIESYIKTLNFVSVSLLQRRFRLGYPRAARLMELLESKSVVGPAEGSKPRKVLGKSPAPPLP